MRTLQPAIKAMGSMFAMAFSDLDEKLEALEKHEQRVASDLVREEKRKLLELDAAKQGKKADPSEDEKVKIFRMLDKKLDKKMKEGSKCSGIRALNRMVHVCMFLTLIYKKLREEKHMTVKKACQLTYPETLANIHGFMVRRTVNTAFNFVPNRAQFLKQCNTDEDGLQERFPGFERAALRVVATIEKVFVREGVPMIF